MKKYIKHFLTITKHKYYVLIECWKRGLYWQGIVHDLSKYSITEFFSSARYFQGDGSPIKKEREEKVYSIAWLNHQAKNKHHWHYWIDYEKGKPVLVPMPEKYIIEMLCDMIGASKSYLKGKFDKKEPYNYYIKMGKYWLMHEDSKNKIEKLLFDYSNK